MKQFITEEQWNEVDKKQKFKIVSCLGLKALINGSEKDGYYLEKIEEFPNIIKMIEGLEERIFSIEKNISEEGNSWSIKNTRLKRYYKEELCDVLWMMVKKEIK